MPSSGTASRLNLAMMTIPCRTAHSKTMTTAEEVETCTWLALLHTIQLKPSKPEAFYHIPHRRPMLWLLSQAMLSTTCNRSLAQATYQGTPDYAYPSEDAASMRPSPYRESGSPARRWSKGRKHLKRPCMPEHPCCFTLLEKGRPPSPNLSFTRHCGRQGTMACAARVLWHMHTAGLLRPRTNAFPHHPPLRSLVHPAIHSLY
jgi:hypothetical protein